MRSHARRDEGFTLIEALISIVILAFGLIAVSQLFAVATTSNAIANRTTTAAAAGARHLELLKALPFGHALLQARGDGDLRNTPADGYADTLVVDGVGDVRVRWEVVDVTAGQLKYITLRSEVAGVFSALNGTEFTTFRSNTAPSLAAGGGAP